MPKSPASAQQSSLVGTETLAYCTSCKIDLAHIIASMKGDRIAKVECKTCKKEHAFKAPKGITEPKKKRAKKATAAENAATSIGAEWEKLMSQHKDTPFRTYTTKGKFVLGDKITHTTFGQGIVGKIIYPNKIEVIFQADLKVLIHGGL